MIAHRRNDYRFSMISQFLADQYSKIEIVALGLPPNIMRSVITRPYDHIQVHFL